MNTSLTKIDKGYVYIISFKFHFLYDGIDYHFYKIGSSTNVENRGDWILQSLKSDFNIQEVEFEIIDKFFTDRAFFYEKDIHFLSKLDIWKFKHWSGGKKSEVSGRTEFFKANDKVLNNYYTIKEEASSNIKREKSLKEIEKQKRIDNYAEKFRKEEEEQKEWEEEYRHQLNIDKEKNRQCSRFRVSIG